MVVILSKRLREIAQQVPVGSRMADIGSDHALLPVYLIQHGFIAFAIAGELNEGPYKAATKQVRDAGLQNQIAVRHGDGLSILNPDEADVVTIAGMGGVLIADILDQGQDKLKNVKRLILQPNVGEEAVRRWLDRNEWVLIAERILLEDGKLYEIITAERAEEGLQPVLYDEYKIGDLSISRDVLYRMGPLLLQEASLLFQQKWSREIGHLERICEDLSRSELAESRLKESQLLTQIAEIKEVLACLQEGKPLSK